MIQNAGEIYRGLDANDDGTVSISEVMNAWKAKKSTASRQQAGLYQQLMDHVNEVDKNHDNKISFLGNFEKSVASVMQKRKKCLFSSF